MTIKHLQPDLLYRRCNPAQFEFKTTDQLEDLTEVIGQPRAVEAVRFGIGVLHKNMSIEQQAMKVRKVKRAESGMILDPVTQPLDSKVKDAKANMKEYSIGGIPIVDADGKRGGS